MVFVHSLQSEWIKSKRSTSFWLCIIGGFFLPVINIFVSFYQGKTFNDLPAKMPNHWQYYFDNIWQNMIMFLLPMGVILASSLTTQLEYKNNTWKQVHTSPQSYATVFFAKLTSILLMTVQFFLFFNIGIVLSAIIPTLVLQGSLPNEQIPFWYFIKGNIKIFITILPIIAIQYLISLRFKNFLVPVGIGLLALIGSLMVTPRWEYAYLSPYSFNLMNVLVQAREHVPGNFYVTTLISFALITAINFYIYRTRKEKG